ncbi:MAG: galactose mutarotase [Bacilli bacterium]|nr:galactose mutarotase [Bacilli bacterium]
MKEYVLKNEKLEAHFISVGACITKLIDLQSGINVIVGHKNLETYKENNLGYMNSIVGRNSGRITDFLLNGKVHQVSKNVKDLYQLHGGFNGFNKKEYHIEEGENFLKFSTTALDGEEGYPGDVNFSITYKLIADELHLIYEATTNKKTILNFTNHAYFNLNGSTEIDILNHELYLNSDRYLLLDRNLLPYKAAVLDNTPLDFRKMKVIGKDINADFEQLEIAGGFDHAYLIRKKAQMNHVATLKSPLTKLSLDIHSTEDVVVFYAGNSISSKVLTSDGVKGYKRMALCLETQGVPNAINIPEFKNNNLYDPKEKYFQETVWKIHQS